MFKSVYHVTVPRKPSCEAFFCAVPNCIVAALHSRGLSTPLAFVSSKCEARRKKFLNFEIQTLCNHFETTSHRVHCKQPAIIFCLVPGYLKLLVAFILHCLWLKRNIWICLWKFQTLSNHFETNIVCFARNQAIFSFCFTRWLTSEVFLCLAEEFFEFSSSSLFVLVVQGNMSMLSNKLKSSKTFVAFRCNHCKSEYRTQRAYDFHRQYRSTLHMPCSDARNQRSITFTEQQDLATGIMQEHAVSYLGNICHNACCNGMRHELHFHYMSCT